MTTANYTQRTPQDITTDAVYRKLVKIAYDGICEDIQRRTGKQLGALQEAEAVRASEYMAYLMWPEVYRYKRLYDEAARQLTSLYDWADENGIHLPGPDDGSIAT